MRRRRPEAARGRTSRPVRRRTPAASGEAACSPPAAGSKCSDLRTRRAEARPGGRGTRAHRRGPQYGGRGGRLAGRDSPPVGISLLTRTRKPARPHGDRHRRRSGDARDLQQPVHEHRRADGCDAREDRPFGQHQGTARFLLRRVQCRWPAHRQCAAHAGSPGLHGSVRRDRHRAQSRHAAGRRLPAQCALQRRHPPARHHRGDPGLRWAARQHPVLRRRPRPPCRRRRQGAGLDDAARRLDPRGGRGDRQFQADGARPLARAGSLRALLVVRRLSVPQPRPERRRHQGPDRRQ